jgi:hypothetical protein
LPQISRVFSEKNGCEVSWDHDLAGGSGWAGELAREIFSGLN